MSIAIAIESALDPLGYVPPQDLAAEQCVLGSMLLSTDAIADVVDVLRGSDFYRPHHELIFTAIVDLYGRGEPVDAVTVADELGKRGQLVKLGGGPYVHDLLAAVPLAANAGFYASIVRDKAVLRRLADAATHIAQLVRAGEGEPDDLLARAQAELHSVIGRRTGQDLRPLSQLMQPVLDAIESIGACGDMSGVPTGFLDLDELTGGLHPGQMVIVAARPGLGKSTMALDIARSASIKHRLPSAIFSLEMSHLEITMRLLSAEASVPLTHIRSGQMSETDWDRIAARMTAVSSAPMYIDDSPNLTITEIRAKARRLRQQHDLKLMIIDYIQLMTSGKRVESRQVEVSEFSRQIKLLAKELQIPVVALSQLNRGPEQRTDKKPMLSDLRESGSLEQDADLVILLNLLDLYDKESERAGEADVDLAKHRNGPTRTITVAFQGHYSRFIDMRHP
jgi:replicative DNA helicase